MEFERSTLDELASFAQELARRGAELADDVEVRVTRGDAVSFAIENRNLAPELKLGRLQVGLRALKGGRLAVAATTSLDVNENLAALKAALTAGRPSKLGTFSARRLPSSLRGHDASLSRFLREPRALQELAATVRDRAFAEAGPRKWVESVEGRLTAQTRWLALATRAGSGASLESALAATVEVNSARTEREVLRGYPSDDALLRDLGARAVRAFPEKRVTPDELGLGPAARVAALLEPEIVELLFRYPAHEKFLASSVASGQASLTVGEAIADPRIRLVDTGRPDELASDFDDELVPRGETELIARGAFRGYVSSRASAQQTGLPETGNGARFPLLAEDVNEAPVRDKLLGLAMDAGTRSAEDLLRSNELVIVPRALLGIHGADRARTAFSVTVADGVAVRGGQVVGQLAPGRWNISGRVLPGDGQPGLLQRAEPGRERRFTGGALLPHLLVELTAG